MVVLVCASLFQLTRKCIAAFAFVLSGTRIFPSCLVSLRIARYKLIVELEAVIDTIATSQLVGAMPDSPAKYIVTAAFSVKSQRRSAASLLAATSRPITAARSAASFTFPASLPGVATDTDIVDTFVTSWDG